MSSKPTEKPPAEEVDGGFDPEAGAAAVVGAAKALPPKASSPKPVAGGACAVAGVWGAEPPAADITEEVG